MKNKKNFIFSLTVCLLSGCLLCGCGKADVEQTASVSDATENAIIGETEPETMPEETTSEETIAETAGETPEFTVWDGSGEFRKLGQHPFVYFQYKNGTAYYASKLPLAERLTGEYPGKASAECFYMTDDTLYYLQDDLTSDSESESMPMRLFAQPIKSTGKDVVLLAEDVYSAIYCGDSIVIWTKNLVLKKIDASTGEVLCEFKPEGLEQEEYSWKYTKEGFFRYSTESGKGVYYDFETQSCISFNIPKEYADKLKFWEGNIFSKIKDEDGTWRMIQLYEQQKPVWRVFPKPLPSEFKFVNGKVFYYDEEKGIMEYNLEKNQLRVVCDVEPDEFVDRKRSFLVFETIEDNGAVLITEMNSYNLEPNTFCYFVDENGKKKLLSETFSS